MTCPSPEYCALNGCSNNGCARAPYRVAPSEWVEPASPPVSHLLFGFACLMAWPLGIGAVLVALWVMT